MQKEFSKQIPFWTFLFIGLIFFTFQKVSADENEESLWEYGLGFGYVHFAQYPASNQYTNLLLPFPTFQYRGKIIRADDRDGTRAYIYKAPRLTIELSGGGTAPVYSSGNDVRSGMPNLPWVVNLGPQLVYQISPQLDYRLGIFQATLTDFQDTRFSGQVVESKFVYQWESELKILESANEVKMKGRISLEARAGSKQFLDTYFTIRPEYANPERFQYEAKAGFLDFEFSYFQSFKLKRTAIYYGFSIADYSGSVNRLSPLHNSDYNLSYVMGLTYELAESKKASVDQKNTEGLIH